MVKLLKKYSKKYSSWGWKDPRTCLTIFKWYEVMKFLDLKDQLKIVYVSRNALLSGFRLSGTLFL